jgi:hypothetical protein
MISFILVDIIYQMKSSILVAKHSSLDLVDNLNNIVSKTFTKEDCAYFTIPIDEYRKLMIKAQDELNEYSAASLICTYVIDELQSYLKTDKFLIQSNLYLRASRPSKEKASESIGFHRETFYGDNMEKSINVWTPLRGVNKDNTLRYVPDSHLINDNDIQTSSSDDKFTDRFSDGHKLGFQYAPKKIQSGVDINNHKPMLVNKYSSAIFNGNLIHGGAVNKSKNIRFSLDFRIIRSKDYKIDKSKQSHFSSGKSYFIEFN